MNARPITLILNCCGDDKKEALRDEILEVFNAAGRKVKLISFGKHDDFNAICEGAVIEAKQQNGIVVAAGGDGTVSGVAALCHKHQATLGVIPLGTFNYFAREHGVSTNTAEATEGIINGVEKKVSAGFIGERIFLNNASFGLYTKIIKNREKDKKLFGRFRIVDMVSAMNSLFKSQKSFTVRIKANDIEESHRTTMVFIGNSTLQLANLGLNEASCTSNNQLAVIIMKKISRWETARLLFLGAVKNLSKEETLETFCSNNFEVSSERKNIELALDGEIIQSQTPLKFKVEAEALTLIVPIQKEKE